MTREEAISLIKSAQLMLINPTTNEPVSDLYAALDMAIQALSQEPKYWMDNDGKVHKLVPMVREPCDDAISREWLMRKATERFYTTNYFNHISAMIEEAPSVTKKSGMWNTFELFQGGIKETWYECPKCKWSNALLIPRNYCPNCGAKMESEDKE